MVEIIPAIIPPDLEYISEKLSLVKGIARTVQIDFVDGLYAPPKTWPFNEGQRREFEEIVRGDKQMPYSEDFVFEFDLLLKGPENFIDEFACLGPRGMVVHIESTGNLSQCIRKVREKDIFLGLAIKPSTSLDILYKWIDQADFVQFMGNDRIGYNGVTLDEGVLDKIREVRAKYPEVYLAIDIGVNTETASRIINAGINKLISGSTIFGSRNIEETMEKLSGV